MIQLVRSRCPGCQNLLRIPAEWLHQPIRCKHCGMVMHAKQSATPERIAAVPPPAPANPTPPPATHPTPAAPPPVVLLAKPVVQAPSSSPFGDFGRTEKTETSRASRRNRKSGAWWKGPLLALAVFVIAGVVAVVYWDRIKALVPPLPNDQPVARNNGKGSDSSAEPSTKKTNPDKGNSKKDPSKVDPSQPTNNPFPRRALVISVHDYLYANPIHDGLPSPASAHNLKTFLNSLTSGLKIPTNQVAHLSDVAAAKWKPRAPTKEVIEKTLTNFLESSRPRDRILVFFIGHSVELGDDVYLAPIEGELDNAATLIPLKWIYERMAKCKARQKVLVFDGNRYNQTFGQERPGSGEMGPKLDAMLKEPPAGVQVWSACVAKQKSYETDDSPVGVFLDELQTVMEKGLSNKIQRSDEPFPLDQYVDRVNQQMKKELGKRKLEQVSRLAGKEADAGLTFDKKGPAAPDAIASLAGAPSGAAENVVAIESVLNQIGTPPVKVTHEMAMRYDALPPFPTEVLKKYEDDNPNSELPLRKAVMKSRATLWAIYPGAEPKELASEVAPIRKSVRVNLDVLKEGYRAPNGGGNAENQFKGRVEKDERDVARIIGALRDAREELESKEIVEARDKESKRWQANYDFILARILMEYAYLFEYQSMLGQMRKEFPPRDPALHSRWKLASQPNLQGDGQGKSAARKARTLLDKIAKNNAKTPWEVLAKREKLTNLGLEWQAAR